MNTHLAFNSEIFSPVELADGKAPEWVELIPAGPTVIGRDGREWLFDSVAFALVLSSFAARAIELPIDWEHATQHRAPVGKEAPAGGWIKQLEIRNAALWGRVEWTPRAAVQIETREYRFLSPVFEYDPDNSRVVRLISAGLTNKPNFRLTALNHENPETTPVNLSPAFLASLGLPETATEEQALAAIAQLKTTSQAANREKPNLELLVPRADFEALRNRAINAEQALATQQKSEHDKEVEAALAAATQAGKIAPASVEYHRAACQDATGLARFKTFTETAPTIAAPSGLDDKKPTTATTALNAEEQAMCLQMGLDPLEFAKNKPKEA